MSRRAFVWLGLGAAGAGGYYLYSAGGDPKGAQKQIEHDAARASAKLKGEIPGKEKEVSKKGEELSAKAGAQFDSTVAEARAKLKEFDSKADQYKKEGTAKFEEARKEAGKELNDAIDKFDKKVEEKTATAKSGIASWFGFGK